MLHTALIRGEALNIYRTFHLENSPCEEKGRRGGVEMVLETQGSYVFVKAPLSKKPVAAIIYSGTETRYLDCHVWTIPSFMSPIVSVEVWIHDSKHDNFIRDRKSPQLENICGVAVRQRISDVVLRLSSPVKKKRFGYAYTIPTLYGNVSFDKGYTNPLFRGVWDWAEFQRVMHRQGVQMEDAVVSLVVLSANLGRKIAINVNSAVAMHFASRTGMKIVPSIDDQNNTIRFSRDKNKRPYMNFILNRNGGVNVRFFLENCVNLSEENIADFKEETSFLIQTVLDIS